MPTTLSLRPRRVGSLAVYAAWILLALLVPWCVFAQSESAGVSGRVTDQQNAVIPNVEVEIRNVDTNSAQVTKTNGDGIYSFPSLRPGNYVMSVRKEQFQTVSVTGITLHVQDSLSRNFTLQIGSSAVSVTVEANGINMNTTDATVSTVIDRNFAENLPLNGRSFNTLLQLTPGVAIAAAEGNVNLSGFSVAGQRTDANNFSVDGVSANFGALPTRFLGQSGAGSAQAFSALGGTSSLVSVEALQEFRVETSSSAPEFGRSSGGQVMLTTRSGTNEFHGGIYDYFRNDVLDANDWFNNAAGVKRAAERHNDFGGFLGGPIVRNRTFFFFSYEGARLRLPNSQTFQVPSVSARSSAPATLAPFLNAYPLPNGPVAANGFTALFTGTYSNRATLNATSIRIDHAFNGRFSVFGRYNNAPSEIVTRVRALNDLQSTIINTQTFTAGVNMLLSNRISNTLRGNYSTQHSKGVDSLDAFGGAVAINPSLLLGTLPAQDSSSFFTINGAGTYATGPNASNTTKQFNLVDGLAVSARTHQLKFGGDYRALYLDAAPSRYQVNYSVTNVQTLLSTGAARSVSVSAFVPAQILSKAFSLYAQDTWKIFPRLTITYGARWELSPAPSARGTTKLAAWQNVANPAAIALAPPGAPPWETTYGNVAPRIGVAYSLTGKQDLVLRASWGMFYDLGTGEAASLTANFPNASSGTFTTVSLPISNITPFLPAPPLPQPPFPNGVVAFDPNLKLPRSYQWNVALEKSFEGRQAIALTYVGQAGRDLLRLESAFKPNPNFVGNFELTANNAHSNYDALQVQYRKPFSGRLQALLNYTWSHSLDNASDDVVAGVTSSVISGAKDYASSSFDVRHSFSGALSFSVPAAAKTGGLAVVTKDWFLDTVVVARSGFPFNAVVFLASPVPGGFALSRPDKVPGQPYWIPTASAPGGKVLNPAAFSVPSPARQGTEGRNDIPGFGLTQVDLSVARKFRFERVLLEFRTDAFNLFNHPNFDKPSGLVEFGSSFLKSGGMLNQGLGGLNPLFQEGGPRSLQLSLKLTF